MKFIGSHLHFMKNSSALYNSFAEIYLDNLENNINVLQGMLNPGVRQMAVIKANAYGHGAIETGTFLEDKVDLFGVCSVTEAIELRENGIKNDILVLGAPNEETAPLYNQFNLTAIISSLDHFDWLTDGTKCHIKFDTGMGRFGFYRDQVTDVLSAVESNSRLHFDGILTHFATADDPGSPMVLKQLDEFIAIRSQFDSSLVTHAANTGALAFYKGTQFDMVRTGIGIYGYPPGNTNIQGLLPVLIWKSHIATIKRIKKGKSVSYGAKWRAPSDGYIGVIPVGYADGLRRDLTQKLQISIKEHTYPLVGTITMDYVMVYFGKQFYPAGTPVTVMGNTGNTAKEWSEKIQTIPYEILCGISTKRVERVYL